MRKIEVTTDPAFGQPTAGRFWLEADGTKLADLVPGTRQTVSVPEGAALRVRSRWNGRSEEQVVTAPSLLVSYEPQRANWVVGMMIGAIMIAYGTFPEEGWSETIALVVFLIPVMILYLIMLYRQAVRLYPIEDAPCDR